MFRVVSGDFVDIIGFYPFSSRTHPVVVQNALVVIVLCIHPFGGIQRRKINYRSAIARRKRKDKVKQSVRKNENTIV